MFFGVFFWFRIFPRMLITIIGYMAYAVLEIGEMSSPGYYATRGGAFG